MARSYRRLLFIPILLVFLATHLSTVLAQEHTVVATVPVGTNPRAVAVNPTTNRIYVTSRQDDTVSVIDGEKNQVLATIQVGDLPEAVAVNPATNKVYVANRNSFTISIMDGASNTVVNTLPVQTRASGPQPFPNAIAVNTATNLIYVAVGGGANVLWVLRATDDSPVAEIAEPWS